MSAMRAPEQGKVIRVGVLQDGKIVMEKRLEPGQSLTVGRAPGAVVPCPLPQLPRRYALIEAHRGRFRLRVPRGIDGKLSHEGQVLTLAQLRQRPPSGRGRWDLPLADATRGSIKLGELTVLFQLVQAPPIAMRQLQRPDFRPKLLTDDDPVFMGFLGLFTVMAAGFAAYTSTVQTPELMGDFEQVERFALVIMPEPAPVDPDPIEPEPVVQDDSLAQHTKDEPDPEPIEPVAKNDPLPERPLSPAEARAAEAQRKADLRDQVYKESAILQWMVTTGESEGGVLGAHQAWGFDEDLKLGGERDLDEIASLVPVIKEGGGAGTSREDVGLELNTLGGGKAGVTDGGAVIPEPTIVEPPDALPENSPDAARVHRAIRGYYPRVKACYERRLKEIPNLQGRIEVEWVVDGGEAMDIWVLNNSTRDRQLAECIADSIDTWHFPADVVGFSVVYPFVLYPG